MMIQFDVYLLKHLEKQVTLRDKEQRDILIYGHDKTISCTLNLIEQKELLPGEWAVIEIDLDFDLVSDDQDIIFSIMDEGNIIGKGYQCHNKT